MDWEGNEWADSEWPSAAPIEEEVGSALKALPKGSPAAVLTPEIDDIHAWEDVLEERSSPRPTSTDPADEQGTVGEDKAETSEDAGSTAVREATEQLQDMQVEEESEVEDEVTEKIETGKEANALGLAPPISMSSISVDDPHWGSDVEAESVVTGVPPAETTKATALDTVTETHSEPQAEPAIPVMPVSPAEVVEEVWGKPETAIKPVSPVEELKEGWGDSGSVPNVESSEEPAALEKSISEEVSLPTVEDEGWGDGGDWGDFEEGEGFDDPETVIDEPVTPAVIPVVSSKKTPVLVTELEFPQPLEELVGKMRGSENTEVNEKEVDTPILSYREKSRKLYNSLIRPNCQFIESKRAASEDNVVKWKGSEFEKILKGEIKKLQENDSKNLKRVFKFGWSNGGAERSGSRGRPLSMPPPKNNEPPVQIPGLTRSSTMSRASTASPAPASGGLTRSSSLRERGRDMTRNKPPGLVQTAIAGAVGQRVASSSPSMSPAMSPISPSVTHGHHHSLSSVFGRSKSKSHSKSSSFSSITSPLDSPLDSPIDSPLGSPILTTLAPTLSPTLTGTPPSGPSRSATPVSTVPPVVEEDSFADFVSATPVASTQNSPIVSPKIGSPISSPLGSKVTSPKMSHPQISSPLAGNGNNDLLGLDMSGFNINNTSKATQPSQPSNSLGDFFDGPKPAEPKNAVPPMGDFFDSKPLASPALSTHQQSPLDDFFGSSAKKSEPQAADGSGTSGSSKDFVGQKSSATTGDQLDDIFGTSSTPSGNSTNLMGSSNAPPAHKSSDFGIFDDPKAKPVSEPAFKSADNGSEFDIFNSAPAKQNIQPAMAPLEPSSTGLSGFEIFDKPSATPSIQITSSKADDDEWGDFTDSVATTNRPRKNSYNSAADVTSNTHNIPSSEVAQSISQSSTQSLFDTTFLDAAMDKRQKSKSPSRSPVAPMKLVKKPVAFELDMGPLQPGSKYKQQSEDKLVNDIVNSLPNLDFMAPI
ncbi:hypothetical protein CJU90_3674 [Yarrowia sp. C11]|nr:hypothetical protein CKK34_5284 [Yarrowia sp. E02]KAG5367381.1 hypothetical protein CJU90_3674 [Yarrowia sp. C11]